MPGASGRNLMVVDKKIFYHKHMSDSVFIIDRENAYPRFKIDFGTKWAWNNPKHNESIQNAMKIMLNEEGMVVKITPYINRNFIFLSYYQGLKNEQKGYINLKSGMFHRLDMRKQDRVNFDLKFLAWEGNHLVCSLQSYDIEEFLGNLEEDQFSIAGDLKYEDFKYSENPVLLKIKFKESLR